MRKNGTLLNLPVDNLKHIYNFRHMDVSPLKDQWKEFLSLSLDRCMDSVSAESGSIFLFDDQSQELILELSLADKSLNLEGLRTRVGDRIAGQVALNREPLLVQDIDNEPCFNSLSRFDHYKSKSFMSVPLEISGELVGVISLTDKSGNGIFDDTDLNVFLINCKYVGVGLHSLKRNLENHQQLNEKLTRELDDLKHSIDGHKKFSSMGKLVGGLVHEINNPLDGVIRYVNLSLDSLKGDEISKEYLMEAKKGLNRITRFVRSLLDFSWGLSSSGRPVDINKSIEECLFQYSHHFASYRIKVKNQPSDNLPKISDYGIKIVFNNIIKNAYEAMKEKGGSLRISTFLRDGLVEIRFIDSGPGISSAVREKMFDPFFTTKSMGEGSGLGLAISLDIIQRYQGNISVRSQEKKGTTIKIVLPFKKFIL